MVAVVVWLKDNVIHNIYGPADYPACAKHAHHWATRLLEREKKPNQLKPPEQIERSIESIGTVTVLATGRSCIEVWAVNGRQAV